MAKSYYLQFGTGDPRTFTGLVPVFQFFKLANGSNVTPPAISEVSTTGIYTFTWGTTTSITFLADAATTSPGTSNRYVAGSLDPADSIDEIGSTMIAIGATTLQGQIQQGSTLVGIGNTSISLGISGVALGTSIYALSQAIGSSFSTLNLLIGTTASIIGDTVTSPVDLFGYMKRTRELFEGQQQFVKSTGALTMLDRTGATMLVNRTVTNSASIVLKF